MHIWFSTFICCEWAYGQVYHYTLPPVHGHCARWGPNLVGNLGYGGYQIQMTFSVSWLSLQTPADCIQHTSWIRFIQSVWTPSYHSIMLWMGIYAYGCTIIKLLFLWRWGPSFGVLVGHGGFRMMLALQLVLHPIFRPFFWTPPKRTSGILLCNLSNINHKKWGRSLKISCGHFFNYIQVNSSSSWSSLCHIR